MEANRLSHTHHTEFLLVFHRVGLESLTERLTVPLFVAALPNVSNEKVFPETQTKKKKKKQNSILMSLLNTFDQNHQQKAPKTQRELNKDSTGTAEALEASHGRFQLQYTHTKCKAFFFSPSSHQTSLSNATKKLNCILLDH